jgi:protein-L-isoaspartate(D-aspartate) O-methyltransferase
MEPGDWQQAVIEFADRDSAEQVATGHLRPELAAATADGMIAGWFFVRKFPCWRLRYLPPDNSASQRLAHVLDGLAARRQIAGWTPGVYEPEVLAFGGAAAMDAAHALFCEDSRHILDYLACQAPAGPGLGRRELAILLSSVLMRGAGQDLYEQADVWARVAQHRPAGHPGLPAERRAILKTAVYRLMTVDAHPASALVADGPLAPITGWIAAFDHTGSKLADLARRGVLERGLRAVLTHHVIFHLNRMGLPTAEQSTLSALAKEVVMAEPDTAVPAPKTGAGSTTVSEMDTAITDAADRLRHKLASQLRENGTVRTVRVDAALRSVPRHLFVPAVPVEEAYTDDAVFTKRDSSGVSISAASQPTIVAMMLEQLHIEPGQRILEIGAGTGYNAALLAHLAGENGQVTTIDVDQDIVAGARSGLAAAGYPNVRVIHGDGALGYADGAPYDRIIATVGAWDLPAAWLEQLTPGGWLVVPLRLRGSVSRSMVFERRRGHWRSLSSELCTFMPLRGIADDARRIMPLTPDGSITLWTHQDQDVDATSLAGVFGQPRSEAWTGVVFGAAESFEWLDLWLACVLDNAVSRMPVQRPAAESGLVKPQFGWGAMATAGKGSLAYLTLRPTLQASDGTNRYEVGVIAHGSGGGALAERVVREIQAWDRDYRPRTVRFEIQPADTAEPIAGQFTFRTPRNRLAISWE